MTKIIRLDPNYRKDPDKQQIKDNNGYIEFETRSAATAFPEISTQTEVTQTTTSGRITTRISQTILIASPQKKG